MRAMVAELFGKATGCSRGKGGSMHLIAPDKGVMGMSAVVGTTVANAVGHAYALRFRKSDAIVASFFGDGATEEGVFAESLNFAVLKKLPILFVCENNGYAIHTHQSRRQGSLAICDRARAHGMPAEQLDGNDLLWLTERVSQVVDQVRGGAGPMFLEVQTYRWREHVGPGLDFHLGYRDEEEAQPWLDNDAVPRLADMISREDKARVEREVELEITDAFAFAEASPYPQPAELTRDIYKEKN